MGSARWRLFALLACFGAPLLASSVGADPIQVEQRLAARETGVVVPPLQDDGTWIEEDCAPIIYRFFCVGPYRVDGIPGQPNETSGGSVAWNNTAALVVVDDKRTQHHGPYVFDMPVGDDLRICYFYCLVPYPVYAQARADLKAEAEVFGIMLVSREERVVVVVGQDGMLPLP